MNTFVGTHENDNESIDPSADVDYHLLLIIRAYGL